MRQESTSPSHTVVSLFEKQEIRLIVMVVITRILENLIKNHQNRIQKRTVQTFITSVCCETTISLVVATVMAFSGPIFSLTLLEKRSAAENPVLGTPDWDRHSRRVCVCLIIVLFY